MEIGLIKAASFLSNNWGGGSTTELFCFPESASYAERNFDFRLSTATVEVEASSFTPLEGVARTLMLLEGRMTLTHENHHSKQLNKFEIDRFDGGWKTTSQGKCSDFNLMTRGGVTGDVHGVTIEQGQSIDHHAGAEFHWQFIYVTKGSLNVEIHADMHLLQKGDLLVIQNPKAAKMGLSTISTCEIVLVEIKR